MSAAALLQQATATPKDDDTSPPKAADGPASTDDIVEFFAADGPLAKRLSGYHPRAQQVSMATTVASALRDGNHAVVEAPTGVGKSFAYLVPAVEQAMATKSKIVISTGTIALQEQLIDKDIPLLQKCFPGLNAVLVKGRQNYLSRRRLARALEGADTLFERNDHSKELHDLADWTRKTSDGDKADLGYDPPWEVWRTVVSDAGNCLGRKCPHYDRCFFYNARREIEEAHILIVNHHLYFADLALRDDHGAILPAHDAVIFDEAHNLEDVATDHLGVGVSDGQIRYFLDGLWSQSGSGLLADDHYAFARSSVERARASNTNLWRDVATLAIDRNEETFSLAKDHHIDPTLVDDLNASPTHSMNVESVPRTITCRKNAKRRPIKPAFLLFPCKQFWPMMMIIAFILPRFRARVAHQVYRPNRLPLAPSCGTTFRCDAFGDLNQRNPRRR